VHTFEKLAPALATNTSVYTGVLASGIATQKLSFNPDEVSINL